MTGRIGLFGRIGGVRGESRCQHPRKYRSRQHHLVFHAVYRRRNDQPETQNSGRRRGTNVRQPVFSEQRDVFPSSRKITVPTSTLFHAVASVGSNITIDTAMKRPIDAPVAVTHRIAFVFREM